MPEFLTAYLPLYRRGVIFKNCLAFFEFIASFNFCEES